MHRRGKGLHLVSLEKSFIWLLIGQGIIEFGDNFRLLSMTMLLLDLTGSGLAAGFSLVMTPIVGIILSPFAGALGDRLEGRRYLSGLYLLQGLLVALFINGISLHMTYLILILFAGIQIVQDPVYRKMLRDSLQNSHIITGNSLATGVSGLSNLLGPALGGLGIHLWGMKAMFIGSIFCYAISALIIALLKGGNNQPLTLRGSKSSRRTKKLGGIRSGLSQEVVEGIRYFWAVAPIRQLGITNLVLSLGGTSVSFAFYSLAFDVMKVSSGGWGFILSAFYSTRLLAMFISMLIDRNGEGGGGLEYGIYIPLFSVCVSWLAYGFVGRLTYIILALVLEGTSHFIFEIFLWSRLQIISKRGFIARVVGINNILSNCAKIIGIVLAYFLIRYHSIQLVFIINGAFMFLYALFKISTYRILKGP